MFKIIGKRGFKNVENPASQSDRRCNSQSTYTSSTSDRSTPTETHIPGSEIIVHCKFVVWQFVSTTVE